MGQLRQSRNVSAAVSQRRHRSERLPASLWELSTRHLGTRTWPFVQGAAGCGARYSMCKAGAKLVLTGPSTPITVAISATAVGCACLAAPRIQRSEHYAWETCPCRSDFEPIRGCGLGADRSSTNHEGSLLHRNDHQRIHAQGFLHHHWGGLELQDHLHGRRLCLPE